MHIYNVLESSEQMCNVVFDLISLFRGGVYLGGFISTEQYYRLKNVKAESVDKV